MADCHLCLGEGIESSKAWKEAFAHLCESAKEGDVCHRGLGQAAGQEESAQHDAIGIGDVIEHQRRSAVICLGNILISCKQREQNLFLAYVLIGHFLQLTPSAVVPPYAQQDKLVEIRLGVL